MVRRLQDSTRGAIFIDLDGTLLRGNSMKMFMKRLPVVLLRRGVPLSAVAALWWMGLRVSKVISHRDMKWHLTLIARRHFLSSDWKEMARSMLPEANQTVVKYIDEPSRRECVRYIATAAMEEYAVWLARLFGFDGVLATRFSKDKEKYEETRGVAKLERIRSELQDNGLHLESFLTDHSDDLPTAREYPEQTVVVNPDHKTQADFRNVGVTRWLN